MNRRGFITAILAAPLAAVGIFAGIHITYSTGRMAGPDAFAKFKGPVALWTNLYPDSPWTFVEFGEWGRIVRLEKYEKLPFHGFSKGNFAGVKLDSDRPIV